MILSSVAYTTPEEFVRDEDSSLLAGPRDTSQEGRLFTGRQASTPRGSGHKTHTHRVRRGQAKLLMRGGDWRVSVGGEGRDRDRESDTVRHGIGQGGGGEGKAEGMGVGKRRKAAVIIV